MWDRKFLSINICEIAIFRPLIFVIVFQRYWNNKLFVTPDKLSLSGIKYRLFNIFIFIYRNQLELECVKIITKKIKTAPKNLLNEMSNVIYWNYTRHIHYISFPIVFKIFCHFYRREIKIKRGTSNIFYFLLSLL